MHQYLFVLVEVCPPFTVINGKVLGFGTRVDSVVRVECKKGYRLVQAALKFRKCHANGQWTGGNSVTPECKGNIKILFVKKC